MMLQFLCSCRRRRLFTRGIVRVVFFCVIVPALVYYLVHYPLPAFDFFGSDNAVPSSSISSQRAMIRKKIAKRNSNESGTSTEDTAFFNPPPPVNPHPFQFIISEPDFCKSLDPFSPFLLVIVHSAPSHYQFRKAIRETWGNPNQSRQDLDAGVQTKILFALGARQTDPALMRKVKVESDLHHDIIQENFVDSYKNLTYKSMMWLKWVSAYCPEAFQILKVDDDTFVNRFNVLKTVRRYYDEDADARRSLSCSRLYRSLAVFRTKGNKWRVTREEYPKDTYPPFCPGVAFMLSADLPKLFYEASFSTKFFWVDDVYVTGMLSEKIGNVTHKNLGAKTYSRYHKTKRYETISEEFFIHLGTQSEPQYILWRKLLEHTRGKLATTNMKTNPTKTLKNATASLL